MTGMSLGMALAAAVGRMEQNRGSGYGAVATVPQQRPVASLGFDGEGQPVLPVVPALPSPSEALSRVLRLHGDALGGAAPHRDEQGRVDWVPARLPPLTAAPALRDDAARYAEQAERIMAPVADHDLIGEWLLRWAPLCRRQNAQDYEQWHGGAVVAVADLPAWTFNERTVVMMAQRFDWLPSPAGLCLALSEWLQPYRLVLDAARRVAAARDPVPPAREAPLNQPLSDEQEQDRRAAIQASMQRFRGYMAEARQRDALRAGPAATSRSGALSARMLAIALQRTIETAETPEARRASQLRLNGLLKMNPHLADCVGPAPFAKPGGKPESS